MDRFALSQPVPGDWTLEIDGRGLAQPVDSLALAFGTTGVRLASDVPVNVRPGELFEIGVVVSVVGELDEKPTMTFRMMRQGDLYSRGSKNMDLQVEAATQPGGSIRYSQELAIHEVEGTLPYRFLLEGRDNEGYLLSREMTGSLFVQGDAPVIASLSPVNDAVEESPTISVLVADDVKLQDYAIRVDGRALQVSAAEVAAASVAGQFTAPAADWQPRQVKKLTGKVTWVLTPGEHSVEVTASDTIGQEAAPETWTFRVGSGLLATDAAGDDYGPGYYTHPTNPTLMPRGALDLEGFRLYRNGSQISFSIDLKNYYPPDAPPTLATLPMVVDVYLDTDGLYGSGRTDLLAGRNALVRPQDGWEYCLTISREGAKLISSSGSETPVSAAFNAGTGTLSVTVQSAQLGVSDQRSVDRWGFLVATLGYDGMNSGHVKEVTTLGGAHVFGGGAEGQWDPNIIDLLAAGTAQQMMLGSYRVPQQRLAVLSAYRFANPARIDDHRAPVLSALGPAGVAATNPPEIGFSASDDWALDPGRLLLWVDGAQVNAGALVITGNERLASAKYLPGAALADGRHQVRAQARDQAGNTVEAGWEFVVGASAHIATVGGAPGAAAMALRGDVTVIGTAAGGTSWRLEQSTDGLAWTPIASGATAVLAGRLGIWTTTTGADGEYTMRLTVAGEGWVHTDAIAVLVDNAAPTATLVAVGGAAPHGLLKGTAAVQGWAGDEHLSSWALTYGAGEAPTSWTTLSTGSAAAGSAELPATLASLNTAALADGLWTLRLVARDTAGNERESRFVVESDNTMPEALIDTPAAAATVPANTRLVVLGTAYDHHLASWRLECGAGVTPAAWATIASGTSLANHSALGTWDTTGMAPGDYTLRLTVTDSIGSVATVLRGVTLSSAPLARIVPLTPQASEFVRGGVVVQGSAGFGAGGSWNVEVSVNATSWTQIASGTAPVTDGVLASWDTTAATDGAYTVRLVVTDAGGATAGDQTTVTLDNTAPTAAISAPAEGAGIGGKVEIIGTATDANLSSYTLEWGAGAAPTAWTSLATFSPTPINGGLLAIWETRGLEVGAYTLRLRATDKAGAVTEVLRGVQVTTDSIAPVVSMSAPTDGTVTSAATMEVSGSVSDTALASWSLSAQRYTNSAWAVAQTLVAGTANTSGALHTWDVSALEGRYRLTLTGVDASGNTAAATAEVVFCHAAGYARIEAVGPLAGGFVSGAVEVRGTAVAPALTSYVLETSPDGTTWTPVASGTAAVAHGSLGTWDTTTLGDGDHHLRLRVLDASAPAATDTALIPLDNLPPTVVITTPPTGGMVGVYQQILGTATDAHFAAYELHVAAAATPDLWQPVGARGFAVTAGKLGTWVVNGDVGPFKQLVAVPGSPGQLNAVQDLETGPDGRIYALDPTLERIFVYDHQGRLVSTIGAGGELDYPLGLFIKGEELFVANNGAGNVLIYALDGTLKAAVPLSGIAADAPYDVAVDESGLIYVTCSETTAIKVYTRTGALVRSLAPRIDDQLTRYRSIDIGASGNLYASAPVLRKTVKISAAGEYLQSFGQQNLEAPAQLSPYVVGAQVDLSGNVYLGDNQSGLIYQFDESGRWIGATGPFSALDCFKIDDEGMLYVGMPFQMGFVALAPSTPVEAAALPEGQYQLRLRATDLAGHRSETTADLTVERTAPEAQITAPVAGAALSGVVAIEGRATDAHFARYELWRATPRQVRDPVTLNWEERLESQVMLGTPHTTAVQGGPLGTWDTAGLATGSYALLLKAYDAAGNLSQARVDVSVGETNETLAVVLSAPAANAELVAGGSVDVRGSIAVTGGVLDHYEIGYGQGTAPQGLVEIASGSVTPSGDGTLATWDTTGLVQGDYTLLLRASSHSGREAQARVQVRVSAGPTLAVMRPAQNASVGGVVEIVGTIWDEDLVGYTLERGAGNNPASWEQVAASSLPVVSGVIFNWDTAGLDGQYSFRLRATDAAGQQSTLVRQVSADNTPPVASLRAEITNYNYGTYTSNELIRGEKFALKGSATDEHLKSYRLEYGEGTAPTSWTLLVEGTDPVANGTLVPIYSMELAASVADAAVVTYLLTVEDGAGAISNASLTMRITEAQQFAPGLVNGPRSVAVSPQGRLYALDGAGSQVAILDAATGAFIGQIGGTAPGSSLFSSATDVATDAAGNLFVLEWYGRLWKFDPAGVFIASMPIRGSGLLVGEDGTLYVTGKPVGEQHHVRIYDAGGTLIRGFGVSGTGPGLFDSLSGYRQKIARDRFGYLYVSNGDRGAVLFDPQGRFVTEIQVLPGYQSHRYTHGIGVDANGNLLLAFEYLRSVWKTRLDGRTLWYRRDPGSNIPLDLEPSPWGLFVCAGQLQRFIEPQVDAEPTAPLVRIDSPTDGATTGQGYVVVTGSAAAPGFAGYRLAWAAAANPDAFTDFVVSADPIREGTLGFWRVADLPNGTYRLRLTVLDHADGLWTNEVSLTIGRAVPVVSIASPAPGQRNTATATLVYSVSEGTVHVRLDGQSIALRSGELLGPLTDGEHLIRVEATDAAGNVGAAEVAFTVDTVAPSVAISSPVAGVLTVNNPRLAYSVSDGTVIVRLDGQAIAKRSGDALDLLADGAHRVQVEATDAAGNIGAAEVVFTVDTTPVVEPGQKTLTLSVDAGGGNAIVGANAYLFSAAGDYLGEARVTDAAGQAAFAVEAGSYKIRCDYLGYQFWSEVASVTANAGLTLSIPHHSVSVSVSGSYAGSQQARQNVPVYLFTDAGTYLNRSAITDAAGRVSLSLPERWYKVRADYLGFGYWSGALAGSSATITIPEGLAEITVEQSGTSLPATPVYVFNAAGAYLNLGETTDAAGRTSFRLPAQGYRFRADHLGMQYFSAPVLLPADQATAVSISAGGGTVQLSVSNGSAGGVMGAECYLFSGEGAYLNVSRSTDATGAVRFDLADGTYKIRVDYLGGSFWTEAFTVPGAGTMALDLGGGALHFSVDRGGGTPIVGAQTHLFTGTGAYLGLSQATDALGETRFVVPAGSYMIRVDYLGYQFWSEVAVVSTATNLVLSIPHRQVLVTVLGEYAGSSEPRPNLPVHLFTSGGDYLGRTLSSDASGQVVFELPERGYKLRIDALSFPYWSDTVQGTSATVAIPEALAVVAVTRVAQPLAGVPVHLFDTAGNYLNVSGSTGAGGAASFRLPAQAFRFRADNEGAQFFSADASLVAHQLNAVPLSLGGGTFTLTVGDGGGPLAGVPCYLFDDGETYLGSSRVSDAAGMVSFDLPNGAYRIRADYLGSQYWSSPIAVPGQMTGALSIPRQLVPVTVRREYDGDALAVENASVYLFAPGGGYLGESRQTDSAGVAGFTLPERGFEVRADYLGRPYWSGPFVWSLPVLTIAEGLAAVSVTQAGAALGGVPVFVFDDREVYLGISRPTEQAGPALFRLPAGGYRFAADVQGSRFHGAGVVGADQVCQVELATGGGVFGLTVDDGAGAALGGVPVYVFSGAGVYLGMQQSTDAQGHVSFNLSDGEYLFRADYRGYQFWTTAQSIPATSSALMSIPHGTARVHVTEAGVDIAGAPVYLFDSAGGYLDMSVLTDAAGRVEFRLPGRGYSFRADYQGGQHWSTLITIVTGTVLPVEIE